MEKKTNDRSCCNDLPIPRWTFLPPCSPWFIRTVFCTLPRFEVHACNSRIVAGEITNVRGKSLFVIVRFRPTRSRPSWVSHFLHWGTTPNENLFRFVDEISENFSSTREKRLGAFCQEGSRRDINRVEIFCFDVGIIPE